MINHLNKTPKMASIYTESYLELQRSGSGWSYDSKWGDQMEEAVVQWFAKEIPKDARILDFGCGEGRGVAALGRLGFKNVTGLDLNEEKTAKGRAAGLNLICGEIYDILDREFDYIFTSHVLEHVPSIRDAIYLLSNLTSSFIYFIVPVRETKDFIEAHNPSHVSFINDPSEFTGILDNLKLRYVTQEVSRMCPELWGIIDCRAERSSLRKACDSFFKKSSEITRREIEGGNLLYVGVAGDPVGGEYVAYYPMCKKVTCDADIKWCPDIVTDIQDTKFFDGQWDVVICSNVIEHVPNINLAAKELTRIIRPGGHLIIDCPWMYPYHAEPPSFGDYWRISLDGFDHLFGDGFDFVVSEQTEISTHALLRRR